MNNPDLDQKYSQLVDQLQLLNDKFDQFINGGPDVTIQTGAGVIKSISGIVRDLETVRHLQKIVDHRLYTDMTADLSISVGTLVRVWGDAPELTGIYKKQDDGTFIKINYADLYDLTNPV